MLYPGIVNYPTAIKSAWGTMADEMDDTTWDLLNISDDGRAQSDESHVLAMLVRMTLLHDLDLAQLCFGPDVASLLQDAGDEEYREPLSDLYHLGWEIVHCWLVHLPWGTYCSNITYLSSSSGAIDC